MLSNMQKLVFDNLHLPMQQKSKIAKTAFKDWKNNLEQVDDHLVIGIKV